MIRTSRRRGSGKKSALWEEIDAPVVMRSSGRRRGSGKNSALGIGRGEEVAAPKGCNSRVGRGGSGKVSGLRIVFGQPIMDVPNAAPGKIGHPVVSYLDAERTRQSRSRSTSSCPDLVRKRRSWPKSGSSDLALIRDDVDSLGLALSTEVWIPIRLLLNIFRVITWFSSCLLIGC